MPTGLALKQARVRARLSIEQIAQRTKIQLHNLEALENDRFDLLPTGIYLDGIIRAYAHEVGVDAEPLVEVARRARADVAASWNAPITLNAVQNEKAADYFEDVDVLPVEDIDVTERDAWMRPRKSELALPTLAVLTATSLIALFYQATHPHEIGRPTEAVAYAPWIESAAEEPAPPAVEPQPSPRAALVSSAPRNNPTPKPTPAESDTAAAEDALPNVAGAWTLATHVESSGYTPFAGLRLGYEVELEQDGDRVSGIGRKILENGDGIAERAQTPIAVNGTVDGDHVMLAFTEHGVRRETQGTFVLTRVGDGALRGRFTTSAARSAGSVEARRVK